MNYSLTMVSTNAKVGPIPASYSGAQTCPATCPLKGAGCYAELGPGASHWKRVTAGTRGVLWDQFLRNVRAIPKGQLWRHNVAGDLPGDGDTIDVQMMYDLVYANRGRRGFTYTHKPMTEANRMLVKLANTSGFTVNLSANNMAEVDELVALNIGPVVVILPRDAPTMSTSPGGNTVVVCPAEDNDITCARCQVCQKADRKSVIGFRAHGSRAKKVEVIARG